MIDREIFGSLVRWLHIICALLMFISNYVNCQTKDDKVWYNAFEKDIAVANFYVSKPTALGNKGNWNTTTLIQFIFFRIQKESEHELG